MSSALSLATLFSLIAIVTKFTDLVNLGRPALYCFIFAAIAYALAILVIRFRAPAFLQEYPDYKSFDDKKHSHRWVLWQFHTNLIALKGGFKLLPQTVEKKLSVNVTTPPGRTRLPVVTAFVGPSIEKDTPLKNPDGSTVTYKMRVHDPLNFDRDLIMGFTMMSNIDNVERKYVLAIREDDAKCDLKCKELFWIILTAAAKENTYSRWFAWALVRLSVLLLIFAVIVAVVHALWLPAPNAPSSFKYIYADIVPKTVGPRS
ncbi:hypothetical protein [Mesorhizobium humile]|nr:hypothetical protein [Mesorhizobium sp. VK2D]